MPPKRKRYQQKKKEQDAKSAEQQQALEERKAKVQVAADTAVQGQARKELQAKDVAKENTQKSVDATNKFEKTEEESEKTKVAVDERNLKAEQVKSVEKSTKQQKENADVALATQATQKEDRLQAMEASEHQREELAPTERHVKQTETELVEKTRIAALKEGTSKSHLNRANVTSQEADEKLVSTKASETKEKHKSEKAAKAKLREDSNGIQKESTAKVEAQRVKEVHEKEAESESKKTHETLTEKTVKEKEIGEKESSNKENVDKVASKAKLKAAEEAKALTEADRAKSEEKSAKEESEENRSKEKKLKSDKASADMKKEEGVKEKTSKKKRDIATRAAAEARQEEVKAKKEKQDADLQMQQKVEMEQESLNKERSVKQQKNDTAQRASDLKKQAAADVNTTTAREQTVKSDIKRETEAAQNLTTAEYRASQERLLVSDELEASSSAKANHTDELLAKSQAKADERMAKAEDLEDHELHAKDMKTEVTTKISQLKDDTISEKDTKAQKAEEVLQKQTHKENIESEMKKEAGSKEGAQKAEVNAREILSKSHEKSVKEDVVVRNDKVEREQKESTSKANISKEKAAKLKPAVPVAVKASSTSGLSIDYTGRWDSGQGAPAWIQLDMGDKMFIEKIVAVVSQATPGITVHIVSVDGTDVGGWNGVTQEGDIKSLTVQKFAEFIRITTTRSPAIVAWNSITVMSLGPTMTPTPAPETSASNGNGAHELCPDGYIQIQDEATCQATCTQLGEHFQQLVLDSEAYPRGCFMHSRRVGNQSHTECLVHAGSHATPRPICMPGGAEATANRTESHNIVKTAEHEAIVMNLDLKNPLSATLGPVRSTKPVPGYIVLAGYRIGKLDAKHGAVQAHVQVGHTATAKQLIFGNLARNSLGTFSYGGSMSFRVRSDVHGGLAVIYTSTGGDFQAQKDENGYADTVIASSPRIIEGITGVSGKLLGEAKTFQTLTIPASKTETFDKWLVLANWRIQYRQNDMDGANWGANCELECLVGGKAGKCNIDDNVNHGTARRIAQGMQSNNHSAVQLGGQSSWIVQPLAAGEVTINIKYKTTEKRNSEPVFLNDPDGSPKLLAMPCELNLCSATASRGSGKELDVPWGSLENAKQGASCPGQGEYLVLANYRLKMRAPQSVSTSLQGIMAEGTEDEAVQAEAQVNGFAGAVLCKNRECKESQRRMIAANFKLSRERSNTIGGMLVWSVECDSDSDRIEIAYNAPHGTQEFSWVDDSSGHEPLLMVRVSKTVADIQQEADASAPVTPGMPLTVVTKWAQPHPPAGRVLLGQTRSAEQIVLPSFVSKELEKCHTGVCAHIHDSMGCPPELWRYAMGNASNGKDEDLPVVGGARFDEVGVNIVREAMTRFRFQVAEAVMRTLEPYRSATQPPTPTPTSAIPDAVMLSPTPAPQRTQAPSASPTFSRVHVP